MFIYAQIIGLSVLLRGIPQNGCSVGCAGLSKAELLAVNAGRILPAPEDEDFWAKDGSLNLSALSTVKIQSILSSNLNQLAS
jgi:hypothetical protein